MAASIRFLVKGMSCFSLGAPRWNFHQRCLSYCLRGKALGSCNLRLQTWLMQRRYVKGFPYASVSTDDPSEVSSRVISPVTAEVLKSIQYGKERWMDQSQRNVLVKRYEEGIIDNSTESEKLTLEHFQVLWPGGTPIWLGYRRNFLGQFAPKRTRDRCIRRTTVCSNPCPLCRLKDEKKYQLIYSDVGLLSQFISPHSGLILDVQQTGICQRQQKHLVKAIEEARDKGLLPFTIPGPRDPPRRFKAAGVPYSIRNKT